MTITTEPSERFWRKVDKSAGPSGCWIWTASRSPTGYGYSNRGEHRCISAHIFSWELAHGPRPVGLSVLHMCDNPACVNPAHLRLGTQADNLRDMRDKGRHARGSRHGASRMDEQSVTEARAMREAGFLFREIGDAFQVSEATIRYVVQKGWRHV